MPTSVLGMAPDSCVGVTGSISFYSYRGKKEVPQGTGCQNAGSASNLGPSHICILGEVPPVINESQTGFPEMPSKRVEPGHYPASGGLETRTPGGFPNPGPVCVFSRGWHTASTG